MSRLLITLVALLALLSLPTGTTGLVTLESKSYDLTGIPPSDPNSSGGKRVVSTATNSPIYYISKLDLSSIFGNLFPHETQKIGPLLQKRPDLLAGGRPGSGKRPKPRPTTQPPPPPPFKRIPLPFVSNAKPVGSYKLKSTRRPTTTTTATPEPTTPSTTSPTTASSFAHFPDSTTATTATPTTTSATKVTPWWFATPTSRPSAIVTTPAAIQRYTPSKIIRLKTKFISNGQPSSVYLFKSSSRRYSLQDILWRPPFDQDGEDGGNDVDQLSGGLQRRTGITQRRQPVQYRKPAPFYSKTKRPPTYLFQ